MNRAAAALVLTLLVVSAAPSAAAAEATQGIRAGVAEVDASWHVGASAGQYATDPQISENGVDPSTHAISKAGSYGVQSRLNVRAIVIKGKAGPPVAIVKNDLYIPQDLLWRRTAQLLEAGDSGITRDTLTMAVSHDHSSPFYSSTSPGVWTFQDVYDVRFFEYMARRMARAVERAEARTVPVRVGASVTGFDKTARHSFGPQVGDDGTPAGYPQSDIDDDMTVIRFDDVSRPGRPQPLANLVNYSLHPEFLDGNNLISADYLGPLQRMTDRRTGALTIWTTNAVGTSEPERNTNHPVSERLDFTHREYAQAEYGARLMSSAIVRTWRRVERGATGDRGVPFRRRLPVKMVDRFFPGPLTHPYPTASNCRTEPALGLDPRIGTVPDCQGASGGIGELFDIAGIDGAPEPPTVGADPGVSAADLKRAGIQLPDNLSTPSYTLLEEDTSVHLQAIRLGPILLTVCSCEQWADQSRNIKSRTNRRQGDIYVGFDWSKRCRRNEDGTWTCPNPRENRGNPNEPDELPPISDEHFRRMRAQVRNDAAGWNEPGYIRYGESEPPDPEDIKGNYTHTELPRERAYRLTVPIGQANDYNGYIATYREYQRGDAYRKALTGWGPHSSDYMATRLVGLGGQLRGGPEPPTEPFEPKVPGDLAFNDARAEALGRAGDAAIGVYADELPDDGGVARSLSEPPDIRRFDETTYTWNGGSNFTDDPQVYVERRVGDRWRRYADQTGELPVTLLFPQGEETPSFLTGSFAWQWTAHFEAFTSDFDTGERPRSTPVGRYRFAVRGHRREGGEERPYDLESDPFRVRRWDGITIPSIDVKRSGRVRFRVGPAQTIEVPRVPEPDAKPGSPAPEGTVRSRIGPVDYPDSYASTTRFINDARTLTRDPRAPNDPDRFEWFCFECSFRPWTDVAEVDCAVGVIVDDRGRARRVSAREKGLGFTLARTVPAGGAVVIPPHAIVDENGERNRTASFVATRGDAGADVARRARMIGEQETDCK